MNLIVKGTPDLRACLDALEPSILPSEAEIDEILRKRLTKGELTLEALAKETTIRNGDVVIFSISGETPKYNKAKLMVTVGQGLYSKEVEASMVGRCADETYDVQADGMAVCITIQEVHRKTVPEPTDAMAAAMEIEGISTVEEYRSHLKNELTRHVIGRTMYETLDRLLEQVEISDPDEAAITQMGHLEWEYSRGYYMQKHNLSSPDEMPEDAKEAFSDEKRDEYIKTHRNMFIEVAKCCTVLGMVLDVPLTGEMDPLVNDNCFDILRKRLTEVIHEDLKRRQ